MPRIEAPLGIDGAAARVRERSARAFAESVQSQCLSSVSSAGRMTPVAACVDEHVERAERGDLLGDPVEATFPRTRIGSAPSARELRRRLLRRACRRA